MAKALKAVGTAILIVGAAVATGGMALAMGAGVGVLGSASLATSAVLSVGSFSVSAGALLSVGSLVSSIGGSLAQPKVSSAGGALGWVGDPNGPMHFAAGRIAVGGDLRHKAAYGPNDRMFFSAVTVVSDAGPIDAFEGFTANDVPVTFGADGKANSSFYSGKLWRRAQRGMQPEASYLASPSGLEGGASLPNWGPQHKLSAKAATILTMVENSKGSAYKGQQPRPREIIRGLLVYDWRRDSTYPGGSGPQRLNEPSTWAYSANPILWSVKWLLGLWEGPNGKGAPQVDYQVGGIGTRWENIDVASFTEAANIADTHGWTCAAWPSTDDDKAQVLDAFLQAGGAYYIERAGKASCIHRAAPRVSVATITAADTAGPIELDTSASYLDRKNTGVATYLSEADGWKMTALPQVTSLQWVTEDGGRQRTVPVTYSYVDKAKQAAELMCLALAHTREGISGRIPLKSYMQGIVPGSAFTITEPEFVLNGLKGLCLEANYDAMTGVHTVTFVSETDAKYPYAFGQTPNPPAPPALTPVDPTHVSPPLPGDWTITPRPPAPGGGQLPGFDLGGIVSNETATAVIVEYGPTATGPWKQAYQGPPTVTTIPIDGLQPGATYYIAVQYQRDQNYSERYVYGPYTAPNLEPSHLNSEPVQTILDKLTSTADLAEQNRQAVEELEEVYGPTVNAAISAAAAAASEAAAAQAKADALIAKAGAESSASAAQTAKSQAETARAGAETAQTSAANSATTATGAAATATTAAGQSVTAKDQAQGFASAANTSAGSAAGSATAAGNSAAAASNAKVAAEAARDVADSKATAAATSASSAASSSTAAGNSASAANTAKTAAETARGQAQTAATQAASSRDDAAGSAASASASAQQSANSRDAAAGSASAAAGSASTASTKAGEAGTHAAAALASQVTASTAASSAQGVANRVVPERLSVGADFTNVSNGAPDTIAPMTVGTVVTVAGVGDVRQFTTNTDVRTRGAKAISAGRIYQVTTRTRTVVDAAGNILRSGFQIYDAAWTSLGQYVPTDDANATAAKGWQTFSKQRSAEQILALWPTAAHVRGFLQGGHTAGGSASGATWQGDFLRLEDVTESARAAISADASATSASSASASETAAGQFANSASGSAVTAATKAGDASSFASQAAGSASDAAGSAVTASQASGTSVSARDAAIGARNDAQAAAATSVAQSSAATAAAAEAKLSANLAASVGAVRPNLLKNGGLEDGSVGMSGSGPLVVSDDPAWGRNIKNAAITSGTHSIIWPAIPVRGGARYTISGDTGYFHTGTGGNSYLDLIFYDANGTPVLDGPQKAINGPHDFSNAKERLQAHAVSVVAPANAVTATARAIFTDMNAPTFMGARRVKVEEGDLPATAFTSEASANQIAAQLNITAAVAADAADRLASVRFEVTGGAGGAPFQIWGRAGPAGSMAGMVASELALSNVVNGMVVPALKLIGGDAHFGGRVHAGAGKEIIIDPTLPAIITTMGNARMAEGKLPNDNLIYWFGPKQEVVNMRKSNATEWRDASGKAYFAGGISAGQLQASQRTSDQSATVSAQTGRFGSLGGTITVSFSYAAETRVASTSYTPPFPASYEDVTYDPTAQIRLYRSLNGGTFQLVGSFAAAGQRRNYGINGGDYFEEGQEVVCGGSATFVDPDLSTLDRQYRVEMTGRSFTWLNGAGNFRSQFLNVVCVEG
ncbi:fibronectin type III domain-containing protein [Brevundimonas diminuta]|uniref:Fibronectin type-III domain-containing protein n=1 Tax=Brevundimonas diminuta TaxID=293 RepID=A0A2X1B064_BREDI|nr:fibronectin type III domain-containing protein [Brevundimonas diminuta]SPU44224.1 Uncharacterised protein [Brevundimonas diminuta]